MDYDSGSTSSDGDEVMDNGEDDDTIHMTPHANQLGNGFGNPFGSVASSPGGDGIGAFAPAVSKLMSYQRHRRKSRKKRMSSSSASGRSSLYSPGPSSPPLLRSIESNLSINGGYFLDEPSKKQMNSRRESLSLGTSDMQLSDAEQSDGEGLFRMHSHEGVAIPTPVTPTMDDRRNVIRKAVTRRGNMLVCLKCDEHIFLFWDVSATYTHTISSRKPRALLASELRFSKKGHPSIAKLVGKPK